MLVNATALTSSSLWRILISFSLQLFIARRLGLDALGQYTVILAYLNVCHTLSELGLPALLIRDLAPTPMQRLAYFRFSLAVQIAMGMLVGGMLVLLTFLISFSPIIHFSLWLVAASLPFYALTSVSETLFQASERMELVMWLEGGINTLIIVLSLGVLLLGGGVVSLFGIGIATQAVSAALGLYLLRKNRLLAAPQDTHHLRLVEVWHRASPFYALSLAEVLLQRVDILLLSVVGGAEITGIYSAAYNLVRILLKVIQSFWKALYPTLSRLYQQAHHQFRRLSTVSLRYGLLLLLPAAALGTGVDQEILQLVYGHEAQVNQPILPILLWMAPCFLLETYAVTLLMVERRPMDSLWITAAHLVAISILLPILTTFGDATGAGLAALLASIVGVISSYLLLQRQSIPLHVDKVGVIVVAAAAAAAATAFLPWPWLARIASGGVLYLAIIGTTKVLSPEDFRIFRQIRYS